MAMTINAITVANPVGIEVDSVPLVALNMTYDGPIPYYLSQSTTDLQGIHVLKFTWQNLSATELQTLRTAYQYTCIDYYTLTFDDIALAAVLGTTDQTEIAAYPGSVLDVDFEQGYTTAGDGPIIYNAVATFVTQPERVW